MDSGNGPDETSPGRKRSIPNLEELLATRLYGLRGGVAFERRVKRHAAWAEGLRLTSVLRHHTGCVNTLEWHPAGHSLLSSGDDLEIAVWDASNGFALKGHYRTGHSRNVFCVKYVPNQDNSFVSCGMDGDVRLTDLIAQEDHRVVPRVELLSRSPDDMTLKIEFLPNSPSNFLVTHQDSTIRLVDLRNARRTGTAGDAPEQIVVRQEMMFYSLCFDPLNPDQFATCCGNQFVRVYDLRMAGRPYTEAVKFWSDFDELRRLTPEMRDEPSHRKHITDVHFGQSGNLLVNYAGHDVVLFAAEDPAPRAGNVHTRVLQRFRGRRNEETFLKEVRFLGSRSDALEQYVCTGSDTGEVFIWDAASGALVNRLVGDELVVNGVAPHPFLPTLACCGIDREVKVFEYRGGPGMTEPDPLIAAAADPHALSFRVRQQNAPDIVTSDGVPVRMEGAQVLRAQGNTLYRAGKTADALSAYNRALEHLRFCPPHPHERRDRDNERTLVFLNLAACYLANKDYRLAERCCTRALELDSASVKAYYRRARARQGLRNSEGALKDVERALALQPGPDDADALTALRASLQ